jgi:hypothetical protein
MDVVGMVGGLIQSTHLVGHASERLSQTYRRCVPDRTLKPSAHRLTEAWRNCVLRPVEWPDNGILGEMLADFVESLGEIFVVNLAVTDLLAQVNLYSQMVTISITLYLMSGPLC